METAETKKQFIELRAQGYSFDKIAKRLKKSKQTLIDWSKELQGEISNLRAVELEDLYEKYYLLKEHRLQAFGETLGKLRAELGRRKLDDLPTDKLLDLYLKYQAQLREEYVEPQFKASGELAEDRLDRALLHGIGGGEAERALELAYGGKGGPKVDQKATK